MNQRIIEPMHHCFSESMKQRISEFFKFTKHGLGELQKHIQTPFYNAVFHPFHCYAVWMAPWRLDLNPLAQSASKGETNCGCDEHNFRSQAVHSVYNTVYIVMVLTYIQYYIHYHYIYTLLLDIVT